MTLSLQVIFLIFISINPSILSSNNTSFNFFNTNSDNLVEPSKDWETLSVFLKLKITDETTDFTKLRTNSSLNSITSTYPWLLIISSNQKSHDAYSFPLFPATIDSQHDLKSKFLINWNYDNSFYLDPHSLLINQIIPFVFKANGYSIPQFLFSIKLFTGQNFSPVVYNVTVDPKDLPDEINFFNQGKFENYQTNQQWSTSQIIAQNFVNANKILNINDGVSSVCLNSVQQFNIISHTTTSFDLNSPNMVSCDPPPSTYPNLQINSVTIEKMTYYDAPFVLTRDYYYKGESVKITLQIQNTGSGTAYYIYSKFRIESTIKSGLEYYYKNFMADQTEYFGSSLASGATKTITFNIGPLLDNKYALNTGIFKLTKVFLWASNNNEISITTNKDITIKPDPYNHVVFALAMVDDEWLRLQYSSQGFQDVNTIYNLIWPRFWNKYNINYKFLKTVTWDSGDYYDIEEILTQARSEAGRILSLSTSDSKWEYDRVYPGFTRSQNHGFDTLLALHGAQTNHFGLGWDGTAIVSSQTDWGRWADGNVKESDELVQHELSHNFGAKDNNGSEDVMDYFSFWGLWNWLWDLDPIRDWHTQSYDQMKNNISHFDGRW
jgi:hypothetical protein